MPASPKKGKYIYTWGLPPVHPPDGKLECGEEILDGIFPAVILIRNAAVVASGGILRLSAAAGAGTGIR